MTVFYVQYYDGEGLYGQCWHSSAKLAAQFHGNMDLALSECHWFVPGTINPDE